MASFRYDDSLWPLCVTTAGGTLNLDQHLAMLATWDRWFERNAAFIVFRRHLDAAALGHAPGVAKATKNWLKGGAATQIVRHVRAICILIPATETADIGTKPSVETVFGVPGGIFPDIAPCVDWLDQNQWFDCGIDKRAALLAAYPR